MIKRVMSFLLILNILISLPACSAKQAAAYSNGEGSQTTEHAEAAGLQTQVAGAASTAETYTTAGLDATAETKGATNTGVKNEDATNTSVTNTDTTNAGTTDTDTTNAGTTDTCTVNAGTIDTGTTESLLSGIIRYDASYSKYDAGIFEKDYNGDGKEECFIVFTGKGAPEKDDPGCLADIWFGDDTGVKRVAEWQCIDPDTYGSLKLAGKYYFRYDLAFVTEH